MTLAPVTETVADGVSASTLDALAEELRDLEPVREPAQLQRYSRDFSWFSPVLKERLADKRADLVLRPADEEQVARIVSACVRHRVPLTLRGAGTGNYGQCTPLFGGVVMDMTRLDRLCWIRGNVARVQAGVRLRQIDEAARPGGWEMRLLPSTFRSSTAAGFFSGGFGGVGSVTYGSLRDRGNVLGARVMSIEQTPRIVELRGDEALDLHHAYGVNGIILELEFALGPAYPWSEAIVEFDDFMQAMRFGRALTGNGGLVLKLLTVFADPVPQLAGLQDLVPPGRHVAVVIVAEAQWEAFTDVVAEQGGRIGFRRTDAEVQRTQKTLIEHTWNHTTMHALKKDKTITYLVAGFRYEDALEQIEHLYRHFGDEMPMHVEFLRADGTITCSSIPLIRYTTEARLDEIIGYHRARGVHVANPHTYLLEDGNRQVVDPGQLAMKRRLDPHGLLNPGKMAAWEEQHA